MRLAPDVRAALDEHVTSAYVLFGAASPGAVVERRETHVAVFADYPHPVGNFVIRLRFEGHAEASAEMAALAARYRARGAQPRAYLTGGEEPKSIVHSLRRAGFREAYRVEQMLLRDPGPAPEPSVVVRVVGTEAEAAALGRFTAGQFFPDSDGRTRDVVARAIAAAVGCFSRTGGGVATYVERRGQVVSGGLGLWTGSVAGIYNVATRPVLRRQGLATAVTHHLIEAARAAGCDLITLQTTPAGKRLYEKLGFAQSDWLRCFVG